MKVVGDIGSPCRVSCSEPVFSSPPTRTVDFALSLIFCRISISLVPTPYDLKVAQITSCLIKSNAFWKSMKQLISVSIFVLLSLQLASES